MKEPRNISHEKAIALRAWQGTPMKISKTFSSPSSSVPVPSMPLALPPAEQDPLSPCVYIALRCLRCGELRQARHSLPEETFAICPQCCEHADFSFLGSGLTRKALPFYERYSSLSQSPGPSKSTGSPESAD